MLLRQTISPAATERTFVKVYLFYLLKRKNRRRSLETGWWRLAAHVSATFLHFQLCSKSRLSQKGRQILWNQRLKRHIWSILFKFLGCANLPVKRSTDMSFSIADTDTYRFWAGFQGRYLNFLQSNLLKCNINNHNISESNEYQNTEFNQLL